MSHTKPLPLDVRLMQAAGSALFALLALVLLGALLAWVMRLPVFNIRGVTVVGDVAHYNALTLKANVMPRLQGTFFTLDVAAARQVFETMPWVRQAVVRRDFPNRLKVQLQEHQAVAFWGEAGDSRLVNSFGEVFEANVGELESDNLPRLNGPSGQSAEVLAMQRTLTPLLARMDLTLTVLEQSARGSWRAELDTGTVLELGSGSTPELVARLERFLGTVTQASARYGRSVEQLASADLRHTDGYAIKLDGVSTLDTIDKNSSKSNR
ncbi:cell division protein FtsQ/DivIB [Rhodoferax sp.]|uniref:cell division protein FtsQ/DivIB n=1 Tax=Rhodoferax sp. TaxID=50421 RepID=UPI002613A860|nr:cell division protein FtsQ/DivIB [Rhodoferax sp.]MDD2811397.1 cell division protein FtsQ/DivIB [Rhodoferax sp.]MDD4942076.1 cell division protein FtsQ/DivIB [Rhodoferax sp.]MDD5480103.1 cell division protein FtsQ/DivIB [Rhodoferax sp.]